VLLYAIPSTHVRGFDAIIFVAVCQADIEAMWTVEACRPANEAM